MRWLPLSSILLTLACLSCTHRRDDIASAHATPAPTVRCYVGPNMRASIQELADRFHARTGMTIDVHSDEVRKLMAGIESGEPADLFITHDPFLTVAINKG